MPTRVKSLSRHKIPGGSLEPVDWLSPNRTGGSAAREYSLFGGYALNAVSGDFGQVGVFIVFFYNDRQYYCENIYKIRVSSKYIVIRTIQMMVLSILRV